MKDTRTKILDSAERLIAAKGLDGVSLRQINAAAGVSPSVLHYHFGGRDELIAALLERRFPLLDARRGAMLDELKQSGRPATLRELLEVTLLPLAQFALSGSKAEQRFVKVLARLHLERNSVYEKVALSQAAGGRIEILDGLARVYPQCAPKQLETKMGMAISVMFSTLAELEHPPHVWQKQLAIQPLERSAIIDALLDFMMGGIQAGLGAPAD